jgi:hypothetical protein
VSKTQKRTSVFEDLNLRLSEVETDRKLGEARISQDINLIRQDIDKINYEIKRINDDIENMKNVDKGLRIDIETFNDKLDVQRDQIMDNVNDLHKQLLEEFKDTRLNLQEVKESAIEANSKADNDACNIIRLDKFTEEISYNVKENTVDITVLKEVKYDKESFEKFFVD